MDTLDSYYQNFYNFHTNEMGIILKHSLPYWPHIMNVFLHFEFQFNISFPIFQNAPKVVQKRTWLQKRTP